MSVTVHLGDCRDVLPTLPERSVQMVVTSPPYYALRSYLRADDPNKAREIGAEPAPDCLAWARQEPPCGRCYVCTMRQVFGAVWRVLRDDGVLWLNLGDSYTGSGKGGNPADSPYAGFWGNQERERAAQPAGKPETLGLGGKQLLGIPWRVALALQADGWVLRSDVVWAKGNPMPESVQDRPTRSHEYVFLLSKQPRYFYDADAIKEQATWHRTNNPEWQHQRAETNAQKHPTNRNGKSAGFTQWSTEQGRNARTVWHINTTPYPGSHFAVFPEALAERCVRAGSAAQACPTCGAAWVRVVERTEELDASAKGSRFDAGKTGVNGGGRVQAGERYVKVPAGFSPACACEGNDGSARSVVLDPFGGSGTTGRVAERLGRDAVLIELNADYAALHDERLNGVQREMAL